MRLNSYQTFLSFVRLGIGHDFGYLPTQVNWSEVKEMAAKQGLTAIVLGGTEKLSEKYIGLLNNFSKNLRLEWIGEVLQSFDQRYDAYIDNNIFSRTL